MYPGDLPCSEFVAADVRRGISTAALELDG
jgi:hypothetical protein